jgi:hypothetical protein
VSKTIRRIFKVSRSHVVTLPPEWVKKLKTAEVAMIYDNILLVLPSEKTDVLDKVMEQAIKQVVQGGP